MKKVLVIDDDIDIQVLFKSHFESDLGVSLVFSSTYIDAMAKVVNEKFDLYIVDYNIEGYSGVDLIRVLQKEENIENRVILISSNVDRKTRIQAFDLGVSNIVDKPIDFPILKSIMRKNIRMIDQHFESTLSFGPFEIDLNKHIFSLLNDDKKTPLELTSTEFLIFYELIKADGRVVSKDALCQIKNINDESMSYKALEMHFVSIRKKVGSFGKKIKTVRGFGYQLS